MRPRGRWWKLTSRSRFSRLPGPPPPAELSETEKVKPRMRIDQHLSLLLAIVLPLAAAPRGNREIAASEPVLLAQGQPQPYGLPPPTLPPPQRKAPPAHPAPAPAAPGRSDAPTHSNPQPHAAQPPQGGADAPKPAAQTPTPVTPPAAQTTP